jgi:hypothetical protein
MQLALRHHLLATSILRYRLSRHMSSVGSSRQKDFRDRRLATYSRGCAVTSSMSDRILDAVRIVPWAEKAITKPSTACCWALVFIPDSTSICPPSTHIAARRSRRCSGTPNIELRREGPEIPPDRSEDRPSVDALEHACESQTPRRQGAKPIGDVRGRKALRGMERLQRFLSDPVNQCGSKACPSWRVRTLVHHSISRGKGKHESAHFRSLQRESWNRQLPRAQRKVECELFCRPIIGIGIQRVTFFWMRTKSQKEAYPEAHRLGIDWLPLVAQSKFRHQWATGLCHRSAHAGYQRVSFTT